jgi:MSHA biogenesis protein MshI
MEGQVFGLSRKTAVARGRVGLCLRDEHLALAVVRRDAPGSAVLERCEVLTVPATSAPDRYAALLRSAGLPRMPVSCALQSGDYQLVTVEAPDVPPAELRAAMRWRLKDLIDIRIEDAIIDVFAVPGQARAAQGKMMYAVAARRSVVESLSATLADVPLFDVVDIPELCLRNLIGLLPAAQAGVALLHLGERSAAVIVVRGSTYYFSRQMTLQAAVSLEPGGNEGASDIDAAGVVLELQRSLDYYERQFDQPPITKLVVAPFGERAQALAGELARESGFELSTLDLNTLMTCATPVPPEMQASCLLAVGAALREERRSL